ncbi:hypothetical protein [Colwellia sp. MB3u-55]|uniref:hypothetical protein n=1 Tax=Colwellia sp. MB3u-55 TaxID=2759810 RepID=UPI0015F58B07|nr:hypothetical protein [Colwellia sp. MB3u-55]MBA6250989.1 hypothetical protein [Colwellia sp. MB3u-55]
MNYWNKDNFDGLRDIGSKYSAIENYELFGDYCLKKEQGLKKLAVKSLNEFIVEAKKLSISNQRDIALDLSTLAFWNGQVHQLLSFPLVKYLKEVLQDWSEEDSDNYLPFKWLGYIDGDISWYERALKLKPDDQVCIYRIATRHIQNIDFQTHHLDESHLIGEDKEAISTLIKIKELSDILVDSKMKAAVIEEYSYYKKLLECWLEYSSSNSEFSFPEWAESKGEEFSFSIKVYYNK